MPEQPAVPVDENLVLEIIKTRNVHTYFQPVVSLSGKSIVGFEAFSRGGGDAGEVDPAQLFHSDLSPESKVNVDRLCREMALQQFKPIHEKHKHMLLFLNINSEILPHIEVKSQVLKHQVLSLDIDPENVVIECPLGKAGDEDVINFARVYRELGFKFSLDNCDVDDAINLVLPQIKPSFVKVRPAFYAQGQGDEQALQALKNLVDLTGRMGAMVVGQSVEDEESSLRLLSAGVHLQQGYYYTKTEGGEGDPAREFLEKIVNSHNKFKKVSRERVRDKKARFEAMFRSVGSICSKLSSVGANRFEDACRTLVRSMDNVVSAFVLDENGIQITSRPHDEGDGLGITAVVQGSAKGADHAVQDYFLYLDMGYEKFVTPPSTSPFTGETTCIVSRPIYNSEGSRYVVCIEVPHPG